MTHMLQGQSAVEGEGDDLHDDRQKEQKDAEQVEGIERPTLEQRRVFWARAVFATSRSLAAFLVSSFENRF